MKKMIRMMVMAAALFAVMTTTAKAQGGGGGRRGGGRPDVMTILKDSLKITDAGILAKADSINKAYQAESAPLMEAMRGGDADARAKMTAARTKMNDAIKALLKDDQKAEYDKLTQMGGRRGGGGR